MSSKEHVEIQTDGPATTVVGPVDGGPWWTRFAMQAGFMAVLLLVLWGVHDLIKAQIPQLISPINNIVHHAEDRNKQLATSAEASQRSAKASEIQAEAAKIQAEAIKRWVDIQSYQTVRPLTSSTTYGPPLLPADP